YFIWTSNMGGNRLDAFLVRVPSHKLVSGTGGGTNPDPTPEPPKDTTAPVINGISAAQISQTGASISWTTNEASSSQVEYGTSTAFGSSTPLKSSLATSHTHVLSGLRAG